MKEHYISLLTSLNTVDGIVRMCVDEIYIFVLSLMFLDSEESPLEISCYFV